MDNKRIEDMLRNTLKPVMPEGMRERILRSARNELESSRAKSSVYGMSRWRIALAALGITVVAFTGIADYRRGERMTAMIGGDSRSISSPASGDSFMEMRQEMYDTLAHVPVGRLQQDRSKGGDSL